MNPAHFDRISKLFATSSALAVAAFGQTGAQETTAETVEALSWTGEKTTYLFAQSFHGGSIVPTEGQDGRYTVTLTEGTGQTIYFGDRPSRDVGVTDTPQFLQGLGFLDSNPPNAALIVETESGETDVAVVELFNPNYDSVSRGVTYEVETLESWQEDLKLGLREDPADMATLAARFGTAHLLIDDCPTDLGVVCQLNDIVRGRSAAGRFSVDSCWNYAVYMPCEPYGHNQPSRCATNDYWTDKSNATHDDACHGRCTAVFGWVSPTAMPTDPRRLRASGDRDACNG